MAADEAPGEIVETWNCAAEHFPRWKVGKSKRSQRRRSRNDDGTGKPQLPPVVTFLCRTFEIGVKTARREPGINPGQAVTPIGSLRVLASGPFLDGISAAKKVTCQLSTKAGKW